MVPIVVAAATAGVYSALVSPARTQWIVALSVTAGLLLAALLVAFVVRQGRPRLTAVLLHAWTPVVVLVVAVGLSAGLIVVFDANSFGLAGDAAGASGAAGIVGGLAAVAALVVEGSRDLVGAHRTPWLARKVVPVFVGNAGESRTPENAVLWDRLHGSGRDAPQTWNLRGIVETLTCLRGVLAAPSEPDRHAPQPTDVPDAPVSST